MNMNMCVYIYNICVFFCIWIWICVYIYIHMYLITCIILYTCMYVCCMPFSQVHSRSWKLGLPPSMLRWSGRRIRSSVPNHYPCRQQLTRLIDCCVDWTKTSRTGGPLSENPHEARLRQLYKPWQFAAGESWTRAECITAESTYTRRAQQHHICLWIYILNIYIYIPVPMYIYSIYCRSIYYIYIYTSLN